MSTPHIVHSRKMLTTPTPAIASRYAAGLLLFTILLFSYSVHLRHPWFGIMVPDSNAYWQTGSTIKFADYWYEENPVRLGFTMLENPQSVEFPTLASRNIYPSYPPGTIIPVYLISKVLGHEADTPMVMGINLANHLFIALCLALAVYILLLGINSPPLSATLFAAIPPLLELFLPGPLINHQVAYFSDHAVVLPFALFLLLEVLHRQATRPRTRLLLDIMQSLVIFSGVFTDWFFVPVLIVAGVTRWAFGDFGGRKDWLRCIANAFAFLAPALLALCLFLWQILKCRSMAFLLSAFASRTGFDPEDPFRQATRNFNQIFWARTFSGYYGAAALPVLLICLTLLCFVGIPAVAAPALRVVHAAGRGLALVIRAAGAASLPAPYPSFRQHAARHAMAALKYSIPLATIPLVILPLLLTYLPSMHIGNRRPQLARSASPPRFLALSVIMFAIAVGYLLLTVPAMTRLFPSPSPELTSIAQSIRQNYGYNDVLFSYHLDIEANPPQMLALSHKRVYRIATPRDIQTITGQIKAPYHVVVLDKP